MFLFEVTTGAMGESYERAYVWAETEREARDMFLMKYGGTHRIQGIEPLFSDISKPFVSGISDSGFSLE